METVLLILGIILLSIIGINILIFCIYWFEIDFFLLKKFEKTFRNIAS